MKKTGRNFFGGGLSFYLPRLLYLIERAKRFELQQTGKEDFVDADFLLIRKMKQGDDGAFDTFVRKYYDDILRYCGYHCSDAEYAEDLTQETFVNFFAKLSDYRHIGKTWSAACEISSKAGEKPFTGFVL